MNDQEIKQYVAEQLKKGKSLNEILDLLIKEKDVHMTYLDLRVLASELEQQPEDTRNQKFPDEAELDEQAAGELSGVQINIDKVQRPGAQLSGDATLTTGKKLKWAVDGMGRVAVEVTSGNEKPTKEELGEFQKALSEELQKKMGGGNG